MSKEKITALYPIRVGSNVYRPGKEIPAGKLNAKDREVFLEQKKIKVTGKSGDGGSAKQKKKKVPKTPSDPAGTKGSDSEKDNKAGKSAEAIVKEDLLAENKAFTENLLKQAEVPEEQWANLNKEPLIDFYLQCCSEQAT